MTTTFKLGKKDPINKDSLCFEDFVTLLPTVPIVDAAPTFTYNMDLNDQYGDCVVAAWDHARQTITGLLTGTPLTFTNDEIEAFYKTQNPNFPQEDNGMDIQTFLEYLQANKYILGFAKIDHSNEKQMKAAIDIGLAIMTGVQLQQAQESQFPNAWQHVPGSPFIGGHGIPAIGYQATPDETTIVTWGKAIPANQAFISKQMDEAWFILMQEHVDHPQFRLHWDLNAFAQAVSEITAGKIIIPTTNPSVPPVANSAVLTRIKDDGLETLGTIVLTNSIGETKSFDTLELSWKDNETDVSCIPLGEYQCSIRPFYEETNYEVLSVPGRTGVFLHSGNEYTQILGCILVGTSESDINDDGQIDVTNSRVAVAELKAFFNNEDFSLKIS